MADLPRALELVVGQTWTAPLEGSGGGYRWEADVEGDDGVVTATTEYAAGEVVDDGAWRGDIAAITGLVPGCATVRMVRRRPWEASEGADGGQVIRVTVRPH
jgi:hypothetical protein